MFRVRRYSFIELFAVMTMFLVTASMGLDFYYKASKSSVSTMESAHLLSQVPLLKARWVSFVKGCGTRIESAALKNGELSGDGFRVWLDKGRLNFMRDGSCCSYALAKNAGIEFEKSGDGLYLLKLKSESFGKTFPVLSLLAVLPKGKGGQ